MPDQIPVVADERPLFPSTEQPPQRSAFKRLVEFDQQRPGIPGEHLMTAAVGGWLLKSALRRGSPMSRLFKIVAGGLLLARSASGRDGLARFTRTP